MISKLPSAQRLRFLLLLIVFLLILGGIGTRQEVAAGPQATVLRCEPEFIVSDFQSEASFTIYVEDITDLQAADVRMSFDTDIAQVVDADERVPGTQIEILDEFLAPDFVVRKVADNEAGTIWYANTQVNPTQPVSGSGALARVTLQPKKAGFFKLQFTFYELVLNNGNPIPSAARDCDVSFIDPDNLELLFLPTIFAK